MIKQDYTIRSKDDLIAVVQDFGFLPFFANSIPGFSIEEHIDPKLWFTELPGPWDWKGPVIRETGCGYGKFFEKKAAYISYDWFPDFANWRRDGYDFDARYEDGLAYYMDKNLYDLIDHNAPILSRDLKELGNYKKGGNKGFDTVITRLQTQGYVIVNDFVYQTDRNGKRYGWGVAEYSTPEKQMGQAFCDNVYRREPEESYERILSHLTQILPNIEEKAIRKFLK